MTRDNRSSKYLGEYLRSSLFLNGYENSPNQANPAGKIWLALYGVAGDNPYRDDEDWTEVTGTNYARVPVTMTYNDTYKRMEYASNISFPTAGNTWSTIGNIGILNAASGGNLFVISPPEDYYNPFQILTTSTVTSGYYFNLPVGIRSTVTYKDYDYYQWDESKFAHQGTMGQNFAGSVVRWVYNVDNVLKYSGTTLERKYQLAIGRYTGDYINIIDWYGRLTDWIECSGQDYQRINLDYSDWITYDDLYGQSDPWMRIFNKYNITFTSYAPSDWGTINMWVLFPQNMPTLKAFWGIFNNTVNVIQGSAFRIYANDLAIDFTN